MVRGAATPSPLDFDREWERAAGDAGASRALSRNIVRTLNTAAGGSGTTDVVRLGDDALVNIVNCVLPHMARWAYDTTEPMIMLRASLACDVNFRWEPRQSMLFNRPEVVLACMPAGLPITVDIAGGVRQQGIVTIFRAATFARRYGLRDDDLPAEVREALTDHASPGRIASFPVDHRVAALIADTLDSRLHGELRTVQVAGRVAELTAYALDALLAQSRPLRRTALPLRRDLDLAHAALARLDRDYRRPPAFGDLARELGINQNKLKAVFKEAFGTTMSDYCLERRVREAQQLLLEASLTIAQVAERVGYEHQSSFTAAFRNHVGMSPREYRKHRAPFSAPLRSRGR
jgi:AraC-like DNA-binding protein